MWKPRFTLRTLSAISVSIVGKKAKINLDFWSIDFWREEPWTSPVTMAVARVEFTRFAITLLTSLVLLIYAVFAKNGARCKFVILYWRTNSRLSSAKKYNGNVWLYQNVRYYSGCLLFPYIVLISVQFLAMVKKNEANHPNGSCAQSRISGNNESLIVWSYDIHGIDCRSQDEFDIKYKNCLQNSHFMAIHPNGRSDQNLSINGHFKYSTE